MSLVDIKSKYGRAIIVISVVFLAFALRFWHLDNFFGDALHQDEAMRGYDAYSLLMTGKDHRGNDWPMYFAGFSDRSDNYTPLYVYTLLPFIKLFGLSDVAERLPAVLLGTLTVLIVYFLADEFFHNRKIALAAGLLLAVSSWHIFLSRLGMEVVTLPFLFSLGLLLFIKWVNGRKSLFLILSAAVWAVSLYSYSTVRVFAPLMFLCIMYIYRERLRRDKKVFFIGLAVALAILYPFIVYNIANWDAIQGRFNEISVFAVHGSDPGGGETNWLQKFLVNYYTTFRSLFTHAQYVLSAEAVFAALGILYLLKEMKSSRSKLLLCWLAVFPIPTALANVNPHVLRTATVFPLIQIVAVFGLVSGARSLGAYLPSGKNIVYAVSGLVIVFSVYLNFYSGALDNFSLFYPAIKEFLNMLKTTRIDMIRF